MLRNVRAGRISRTPARRRRRAVPRLRRVQGAVEHGFSLVELLVSISIMGIAVVGMAASIFSIVSISDIERRQSLAEAEVRRFAEAVQARQYVACADPAAYLAAYNGAFAQPGLTPSVPDIDYLIADSDPIAFSEGKPATCTGAPTDPDTGAQQITLQITSAGAPPVVEKIDLTKRKD